MVMRQCFTNFKDKFVSLKCVCLSHNTVSLFLSIHDNVNADLSYNHISDTEVICLAHAILNSGVKIFHFVDECPNIATDFYKRDYDTGHIECTEGI